ncbi:uncharacterized protein LOC114524581 [Dendronephthya gigantea]|uniref:uncharacterized protein LOC114524581 n=1 Tax=Dendronephthya gigantea TaxID=151771 RepID=UPI0010695C9C|nr:uncharacterized protein LOC114524581 [Dendronephthya gigantea]
MLNESDGNDKRQAYPKIPESNVGYQLLQKLGWESGGLGSEGSKGIEEPIVVNGCINRQGLGMKNVKEPHKQKHSNPSHQQKKKQQGPIMASTQLKEVQALQEHSCGRRKTLRTQPIITNRFIKEFLASNVKEFTVSDELIDEDHRLLQKWCAKYHLKYDFVAPFNYLVLRKPDKQDSTQPQKTVARQRHSCCKRKKRRKQPIITNRFIKEFLASNVKEFTVRDELIDEDHRLLQKLCAKYHLKYDFVAPFNYLVIRKPDNQDSTQKTVPRHEHSRRKRKKLRKQPIITNRFIKEFLASNVKETHVREELIDEDHRLLQKLCAKYHLKYDFVGPSKHLVIRKLGKSCLESSNSIPSMLKTNSPVKKFPGVQQNRLLMNAVKDATRSVAKSSRREDLVINCNLPMIISLRKSMISVLTGQTKSNDTQQSVGAIKTKENSKQTPLKKLPRE